MLQSAMGYGMDLCGESKVSVSVGDCSARSKRCAFAFSNIVLQRKNIEKVDRNKPSYMRAGDLFYYRKWEPKVRFKP